MAVTRSEMVAKTHEAQNHTIIIELSSLPSFKEMHILVIVTQQPNPFIDCGIQDRSNSCFIAVFVVRHA